MYRPVLPLPGITKGGEGNEPYWALRRRRPALPLSSPFFLVVLRLKNGAIDSAAVLFMAMSSGASHCQCLWGGSTLRTPHQRLIEAGVHRGVHGLLLAAEQRG